MRIRRPALMTLFLAALLLVAGSAVAQEDESDQETIKFGFDFFPFVGTSSALPNASREVSMNLIGGLSGGIEKAELGGVFNVTTGSVDGAQLAGTANVVMEDVNGAQLAGSLNIASGSVNGIQGAGAVNVAGEGTSGLQGAGALNIATGDVAGFQGAGAANIVVGNVMGAQGAGAANIVTGDVVGLQLGVLNIAAGEVTGGQVGIFNYARASTASIGLISIVPEGFTDFEIFASEEGLTLAGLRHGTARIYNVYYAGARLTADGADFAYGLGLGWRRPFTTAWELNIDVTGTHIVTDGRWEEGDSLTKLRTLGSWRASDAFAVFGGPTLTLHLTETDTGEFSDLQLWSLTDNDDIHAGMWIGATLGVRIF